ncbi:MAG: penicillin acylase family protein, partial [Myxococcales bacterium]
SPTFPAPTSAAASHTWSALAAPAAHPAIGDPSAGQIVTANARQLAGAGYAAIGDGGADLGARQRQLRDAVAALGSGVDEAAALAAAAAAQAEEAAAEQALLEMGASDAATEMIAETPEQEAAAEGKRLTIAQKVSKLSIAKKIEWANKKGNKEVRTILLRDPSKLVQLAVIQSPRITEGEIAKVALSRTAPGEVLQYIYNNRQLTKNYGIKVNLVNNPKVPVAVSMRYLSHLRSSELKGLSKNRNVSPALQTQARKLLEKKV